MYTFSSSALRKRQGHRIRKATAELFPYRPQVREALKQNFSAFDVVEFLGNDPIRSQLETFATASVVVAPHGAGLSNMVVSPLHTPVLEIAPISCPPCFLNLAVKVNIRARHNNGVGLLHLTFGLSFPSKRFLHSRVGFCSIAVDFRFWTDCPDTQYSGPSRSS